MKEDLLNLIYTLNIKDYKKAKKNALQGKIGIHPFVFKSKKFAHIMCNRCDTLRKWCREKGLPPFNIQHFKHGFYHIDLYGDALEILGQEETK